MGEMVLIDPKDPEKGYMIVGRLPHIPEYEHKLGELSVTDGVPVLRDAPSEDGGQPVQEDK